MGLTFFDTDHCRRMVHCRTCRDKEKGRGFRSSIAERYGGEVDFECPYGGEWGKVPEKDPSLLKRVKNLTRETVKWVKAGAEIVDDEELEKRMSICKGCNHWVNERCSLCGCSKLKQRLVTSECPIKKW